AHGHSVPHIPCALASSRREVRPPRRHLQSHRPVGWIALAAVCCAWLQSLRVLLWHGGADPRAPAACASTPSMFSASYGTLLLHPPCTNLALSGSESLEKWLLGNEKEGK